MLRAGRFRSESSLGTFIYGVARNQLAEANRRQDRDRSAPFPDDLDPIAPLPDAPMEWQQTVRSEIAALETADRDLLWLVLVEGFRPDEITIRLGLTADAIRQRKCRLLARIGKKLGILSQKASTKRPITRRENGAEDFNDL